MNLRPSFPVLLPLLLAGCAAPPRTPGPPPAQLGAPESAVDRAVVGAGLAPAVAVHPADRLVLPAAYRVILVDGQFELVREVDAQALESAPSTLRIVVGEVARGELAYQPGLLPQELAREVAANRESSARMDNALGDVMQRSRDLAGQARQLQAQSRTLTDRLAAAEARVQELETARATPAPPAATGPSD